MRLAQPIETKQWSWLRGVDLNHRPLGYEPNELPDCSTPQDDDNNRAQGRQTAARGEIDSSGDMRCSPLAGRWVGFVHRTVTTRGGDFLIFWKKRDGAREEAASFCGRRYLTCGGLRPVFAHGRR